MTNRAGSMPITKLSTLLSPPLTLAGRTNKRYLTWRSFVLRTQALFVQSYTGQSIIHSAPSNRSLAQVRHEPFSELWFTASFPAKSNTTQDAGSVSSSLGSTSQSPNDNQKSEDERTLKLGKTLRTLSPLLPNIFTAPLPNEILSPSISLHLFPSTHPHLPVVKSRVPCRAALWTAPVAWGSVPLVGNVKVEITSEKIVRTGFISAPTRSNDDNCDGLGEEKLVVRWKTEGQLSSSSSGVASPQSMSSSGNEVNRGLSTLLGGSQPLFSKGASGPFTGLFVFSFDEEGKIASITIEHADENNGFDKTSKVVTLTDWLLGKAKWGRVEGGFVPGLAYKAALCKDTTSSSYHWRSRGRQD